MSQKGGRDISRGARHELEARDERKRKIKLYFSLPLVSRSVRNIAFSSQTDFDRVSIVCAVARLTKNTKRLLSPSNRLYLVCDIAISREI